MLARAQRDVVEKKIKKTQKIIRNLIFNHNSGKWSYGWTTLGRFDNATFNDLDRAKENFDLH